MTTRKLEYEVSGDGNAGSSAIRIWVDDCDFEDMSLQDIKSDLSEIIEDDFRQRISWDSRNIDEIAMQIFSAVGEGSQ